MNYLLQGLRYCFFKLNKKCDNFTKAIKSLCLVIYQLIALSYDRYDFLTRIANEIFSTSHFRWQFAFLSLHASKIRMYFSRPQVTPNDTFQYNAVISSFIRNNRKPTYLPPTKMLYNISKCLCLTFITRWSSEQCWVIKFICQLWNGRSIWYLR